MSKSIAEYVSVPAAEADPEVVQFRSQFEGRSTLDELVRAGGQERLQTAIDAEVTVFIEEHSDRQSKSKRTAAPWDR